MAISLGDQLSGQDRRWLARERRDPAAPVVLVVEHEPTIRDTLATLLENSGYGVMLTADGTTALCQVRAGSADLVLLDRDLPGRSGLDLCHRMWDAVRDAPVHLPILMLTSVSRPEDPCAGYAAGADDYVPKPVLPAELLARIQVWLRLRELQQRARSVLEEAAEGDEDVRGFVAQAPLLLPVAAVPASGDVPAYVDSAPLLRLDVQDQPTAPVPHRETMLPDLTEPLTAREREVLDLLARRLSNKEIAETLCVSWQTVAKHTNNLYQKLRVPGRRDAVARAEALGILPTAFGA